MKTSASIENTTSRRPLPTRLTTAFASLLFLAASRAAVQAQFTIATNNGTLTIVKYPGTAKSVTIPEITNGMPVTAIGPQFGGTYVSNVVIPFTVTNIDPFAFAGHASIYLQRIA